MVDYECKSCLLTYSIFFYYISPKRSNLQHKIRASVRQYYRRRNIDAMSGDESSSRQSDKKPLSSPENSTESGVRLFTPIQK